jgi:RanBP1 domain
VVSGEVGNEGEEDEETVFSERAKLIQRLPGAEWTTDEKGETKRDRDFGVGVVRINIHKESKKGRILFRLEGSGRVILVNPPTHTHNCPPCCGWLLRVELVFGVGSGLC